MAHILWDICVWTFWLWWTTSKVGLMLIGLATVIALVISNRCLAVEDEEDELAAVEPVVPPRGHRAIRDAAVAIDTCDGSPVADEKSPEEPDDVTALLDDVLDGPRIWVEPRVIEQIETGHLPPEERDVAVGPARERGRHQITEGAWNDAMDWLKRNRGWKVRWDWKTDAHDPARSTVVASTIVNDMLPRSLTCERLFRCDETRPVPDTVDTRVAAYNCGAYRVRKAWQWSRCLTGSDWRDYIPDGTKTYLIRYHAEADKTVETTKNAD